MTLAHARTLLSIEKISYSRSYSSENLKVSNTNFLEFLDRREKILQAAHAYGVSGCRLLSLGYPSSRGCFCLLFDRGKEKEALLE